MQPPADIVPLAEAVVIVSRVAATRPELAELDVNAVLAHAAGVSAVDAHLELR